VVLEGSVLQQVANWRVPLCLGCTLYAVNDAQQLKVTAGLVAFQAFATTSWRQILALPACHHQPLLTLLHCPCQLSA
jgi:hypothetical protein